MNKLVPAVALTLAAATGCGGGSSGHPSTTAAAKPPASASPSACDPADDSCIPPDHPTSGPIAIPAAEVGKPMALQLPTSNGTAQRELTPTGIRIRPLVAPANPKDDEVCFGFKMKNTGTLSWKADDVNSGISWKWFGLDGEEKDDTDTGIAGWCDRYHLGDEFEGMNQPAPLPGKFAAGVYGIAVPKKPGALEITDSDDTPLFRLNYGPKSVQVPIDARGQ